MKQFISLGILLVILSSCGTEVQVVDEVQKDPNIIVEETTSQIDNELDSLNKGAPINELEKDTAPEMVEVDGELVDANDPALVGPTPDDVAESTNDQETESEPETVQVQANYENPAQAVFIDMEYSLDEEGKIVSIDALDTNYKKEKELPKLQENLQGLVGKSIDEIDDAYIAGGSLTVPAVKKALSGE